MRKSEVARLLARRLMLRPTRLAALVQRLAVSGQMHSYVGPPYADVSMIEAARMLLAGVVDEGIAAAPSVGAKYGSLRGLGSSLKEALAHALSRPDCLAPICSSLEIHAIENPYVLLTVSTADGAKTTVFGDMPEVENVDRVVTVSGAALFAISQELAGMPPGEVDDLLRRM